MPEYAVSDKYTSNLKLCAISFDSKNRLHKEGCNIERTTALMDGWKGWNLLAFIVISLKNFYKSN